MPRHRRILGLAALIVLARLAGLTGCVDPIPAPGPEPVPSGQCRCVGGKSVDCEPGVQACWDGAEPEPASDDNNITDPADGDNTNGEENSQDQNGMDAMFSPASPWMTIITQVHRKPANNVFLRLAS